METKEILKKSGWIFMIIASVLIILFTIGFIISQYVQIKNENKNSTTQSYIPQKNIQKTYSEPQWGEMPIYYQFENLNSCGKIIPEKILRSFEKIKIQTNNTVYFEENINKLGINITCYQENSNEETIDEAAYFTNKYRQITNAEINFYDTNNSDYNPLCKNSSYIEVHQILHALGFAHSTDSKSIMNPNKKCNETIDTGIIDKLIITYKQ
ncbi:MAG: matrixin family metalloprotease [Nanoarchaeota archaeon]|nr:matrixin family metalloprotease [Nanoarchaeota archaeon]